MVHQVAGYVHHHQAGDHFVNAPARLENGWDQSPKRTTDKADKEHARQQYQFWPLWIRQGQSGGTGSAYQQLPFSADIPETSTEGQRKPNATQHQRDGLDHRLGEPIHGSERTLKDLPIREERVDA